MERHRGNRRSGDCDRFPRYRITEVGTLDLYLSAWMASLMVRHDRRSSIRGAPDFSTTTVFFGAVGNATAAANFHVTNVAYVRGHDGGGC